MDVFFVFREEESSENFFGFLEKKEKNVYNETKSLNS